MKLTTEQVEKLSRRILETLKEKGIVVLKADEHKILERISGVMMANLRAEDDLDREVERMLEAHSAEINSGKVDYKRMFNMIKAKLAKERGLTL